ncbi:hypothetical protein G7Y89_g9886 [Cudoniella acicularis]|uniref:Uncharacterized protein n=1 Tax=Cudoniella acicularis TaxID=354080 RepID=A0A8H4RDT1_9HELO|nr:hypothetical protein G7Y89_g9886 [Cudoniella acicularis]
MKRVEGGLSEQGSSIAKIKESAPDIVKVSEAVLSELKVMHQTTTSVSKALEAVKTIKPNLYSRVSDSEAAILAITQTVNDQTERDTNALACLKTSVEDRHKSLKSKLDEV